MSLGPLVIDDNPMAPQHNKHTASPGVGGKSLSPVI